MGIMVDASHQRMGLYHVFTLGTDANFGCLKSEQISYRISLKPSSRRTCDSSLFIQEISTSMSWTIQRTGKMIAVFHVFRCTNLLISFQSKSPFQPITSMSSQESFTPPLKIDIFEPKKSKVCFRWCSFSNRINRWFSGFSRSFSRVYGLLSASTIYRGLCHVGGSWRSRDLVGSMFQVLVFFFFSGSWWTFMKHILTYINRILLIC